jgi:hypothetical protein
MKKLFSILMIPLLLPNILFAQTTTPTSESGIAQALQGVQELKS